jgi:hypothetical protein
MTDSSPPSQPSGTQAQSLPFIQISRELIDYVRSLKLTGTQYDLWLFLFSLDPYGDRWIEIPPPEKLGNAFGVSDRTIQRAAQRLADCHLFDFQIERWKAKNSKRSISFPQNSTDKGIHLSATGSLCPELIKLHVRNLLRARV